MIRGYRASTLTIAQKQEANELLNGGERDMRDELRFVRYYLDFCNANPPPSGPNGRAEHLSWFAVDLGADGTRGPGYVSVIVDFIKRRGVTPGNAPMIRESLRQEGLEKSLKRHQAEAGPRHTPREAPRA